MLENKEPSICYGCAHYDWHIEFEPYKFNSFWVHECEADFEPGDEVRECDGFLEPVL